MCASDTTACKAENAHVLLVLVLLCLTIILMSTAFLFFREDKEEQITPLCPQLVVSAEDLAFNLNLDMKIRSMYGEQEEKPEGMLVYDGKVNRLCAMHVDWMDPFRQTAGGVAATVRLKSNLDLTLATVVARNITLVGQGLALCRTGCEIFGFVEPKGNRRYDVRHRTGVHLLTLIGEFDGHLNIEAINPAGSTVCWFKKDPGDTSECRGRVLQHVDVGLVLCCILATQVHRRLLEAITQAGSTTGDSATPLTTERSTIGGNTTNREQGLEPPVAAV